MRVYLLRTPEYDEKEFNIVADYLNSFKGAMKFFPTQFKFTLEEFPFLDYNEEFENYNDRRAEYNCQKMRVDNFKNKNENRLYWSELFSLNNKYRKQFTIEPEAYVVLLTKWQNEYNYLSRYSSDKNIVVCTLSWEQLLGNYVSDNTHAIAYQIVENILQLEMNIDFDVDEFMNKIEEYQKKYKIPLYKSELYQELAQNENVHFYSQACINDYVYNKKDIILKLQSANICPSCYRKMQRENVPNDLSNQILDILIDIRACFTSWKKDTNYLRIHNEQMQDEFEIIPFPVIAEMKGSLITIRIIVKGNKNDPGFNPVEKMLFLFFLMKNEPIEFEKLGDDENFKLLEKLYKLTKPTANNDEIRDSIIDMTRNGNNYFMKTKSDVNRKIKMLFVPEMASFYTINRNDSNEYFMKLPKKYIDIRFYLR